MNGKETYIPNYKNELEAQLKQIIGQGERDFEQSWSQTKTPITSSTEKTLDGHKHIKRKQWYEAE